MQLRAIVVLVGLAACGDDIDGNRPPLVEPFTLSTQEDLPITRMIDALDLDVGNVVNARVPVAPLHGNVEIAGLSLTYTPAPHYHGNDRFDLLVGDGLDETAVSIRVEVASVPDPPTGGADALATNEDTPRTVAIDALLANDRDADGDRVTLVAVGDPENGTVAVNQVAGTITFTPALNFNGSASFVYTITDGMFETPVAVEVVVGASNDPPVAVDDERATTIDTPLVMSAVSLLANDSDPDGQVLSIIDVGSATNGSVTFDGTDVTFTPNAGFTGVASFTYTAFDGIATDTAVVTITVD